MPQSNELFSYSFLTFANSNILKKFQITSSVVLREHIPPNNFPGEQGFSNFPHSTPSPQDPVIVFRDHFLKEAFRGR